MVRHCGALVVLAAGALALRSAAAALDAPGAVEAAATGPSSVRVFWNPSRGASGYRVRMDGAVATEVGPHATQALLQGLSAGRLYRFDVEALGSDGAVAAGRGYLEQTFAPLPAETRCEVLVVGANSAGVAAAVAAGRYGHNVVLTEETRRIGGMSANGLGASDIRRVAHASGFFDEFRHRVMDLYGGGDGLRYEPRVAQQALKEALWSAPGVVLHREVRPVKVEVRDGRIVRVTMEHVPSGRRVVFLPDIVIDATECGDIAAWSGCAHAVGREARSAREPHAGHIYYSRAQDRILPGSTGRADRRLQAYSYLMVVKDYGPGADRTVPAPPGYDPAKYDNAPKWERSWAVTSGRLPNGKFEINQHPEGSDLQEANYGYPTASYTERRRIEQVYRDHALGYLHYIQTVEGKRHIGLSDDDYRDSDGWPTLLYIREARRFDGEQRMDQHDILRAREVARANAIGIGDYAMDSHATQVKRDWTTDDMGEGEFYLPHLTPWHQVPYHIMVPRGVRNLMIPTAVSATHVAYGTYRMEPVRMHFGTAAGVAAHLCLRYGLMPREVPVRQVQMEILKKRAPLASERARDGIGNPGPCARPTVLYNFADIDRASRYFPVIQWLAARGVWPCEPPERRTASSGLQADSFGEEQPATQSDVAKIAIWLAERRRAAGEDGREPLNLRDGPEAATRAQAVRMIAEVMAWKPLGVGPRYADVLDDPATAVAAQALSDRWIDSRLWDGIEAWAPGGGLLLRGERPLRRGQLAQLVWLAHQHIGHLFEDHPEDLHRTIDLRDCLVARRVQP